MTSNVVISPQIKDKLDLKHDVKVGEVHECFFNVEGPYLEDTEEDHQTDPASYWFIAPTNRGRLLKVIFVLRDEKLYLKSAFDANAKSKRIYAERSNQQE